MPMHETDAIDSIHNYYEQLVREEIQHQLGNTPRNADFIADVACVALNQLPPRYIRHAVDMAFYLSDGERRQMEDNVTKAVREALRFIEQHSQRRAEL